MKFKAYFGLLTASAVSLPALSQDKPGPMKNYMLPTIEAGIGMVTVKADAKDEIGKKGNSSTGSLYLNFHTQSWLYGFGLGISGQNAEGSSGNRGIKQTFRVAAPSLSLHALYEVTGNLLLGLQSTSVHGKGAIFDPWDTDKVSMVTYLGPRAEWYKDFSSYRFSTFVQVLNSLNVADRSVLDAQVGITVAMVFDRGPQPAPSTTPEPAPAAPLREKPQLAQQEPVPAAASAPRITLSSKLVSFDLDSIRLRPRSREFLGNFAAILRRHQSSWAGLTISGHTDTSGRRQRNEYLSKGRAESVRDALISKGVDGNRLKTEGHAFRRLLPGLPPGSPEHRRVELEFSGLQGPEADALVQSLNALIEEYKEHP